MGSSGSTLWGILREDEKHGTWQKEDKVEKMKITVVGTGYVGLSLAVLLSQENQLTAVDIVPE